MKRCTRGVRAVALVVPLALTGMLTACGGATEASDVGPAGTGETREEPTVDGADRSDPPTWRMLDAPMVFDDGARAVCFEHADYCVQCARTSARADTTAPMSAFELQCGGSGQPPCTLTVRVGS